MIPIFTIKNPDTCIKSIDIFSPSRGTGGTLCYSIRIDNVMASFEINDEGEWDITNGHNPISSSLLCYINELIIVQETIRLRSTIRI